MKKNVSLLLIGLSSISFAGEPIWDGNKVEMYSEKISEGAFAFYPKDAAKINAEGGVAATSSGLIVGDQKAMIIDTMLNKRLLNQIQGLAKKNSSKPVAYAVNTSAHGDHTYGNMYLPPSVNIIQHVNTQDYIQHHLQEDKDFMIKNFGSNRGIEVIKAEPADILVPAMGKVVVDLGNRRVEIIDFGFAQSGGDLFVWDAKSKTLWAGNAFTAQKPALPWLLAGNFLATLETFKRVHDFLPDDANVIPGHGKMINKDGVKWQIEYMNTVKENVQASVNKGLSLEETVKKSNLENYKGYALYDWVHLGLNVPAAYKDLKKNNK